MAKERRYIWHCDNCRKDRHPIWNGRPEPSCIVCGSTDMEISRPEEDVAGCVVCGEPLERRLSDVSTCSRCIYADLDRRTAEIALSLLQEQGVTAADRSEAATDAQEKDPGSGTTDWTETPWPSVARLVNGAWVARKP